MFIISYISFQRIFSKLLSICILDDGNGLTLYFSRYFKD